ncbi:hypothetical protein [Bradyrhizobium uaiense]|uniref:Uncharacterized protein n=1 Tax=Bradyrhizobium uaiense TaxID=2594946 RepID=A0A6P1BWS8_9BRAD|nr:hypothetical protein [Bradyrhizobium uaiense]NEV02012.1 hypothetical protein [Bradyrhizobium uaiense]
MKPSAVQSGARTHDDWQLALGRKLMACFGSNFSALWVVPSTDNRQLIDEHTLQLQQIVLLRTGQVWPRSVDDDMPD